MARVGLGQSPGAKSFIQVSVWVAGAQVLQPSSSAFSDASLGRWVRTGAAGMHPGTLMRCKRHREHPHPICRAMKLLQMLHYFIKPSSSGSWRHPAVIVQPEVSSVLLIFLVLHILTIQIYNVYHNTHTHIYLKNFKKFMKNRNKFIWCENTWSSQFLTQ